MRCPKCNSTSGDNWSNCNGACPMPMSPYYTTEILPSPSLVLEDPEKEEESREQDPQGDQSR